MTIFVLVWYTRVGLTMSMSPLKFVVTGLARDSVGLSGEKKVTGMDMVKVN